MAKLPNEEFRALVVDLRDKEFKREIYPSQEPRAIIANNINFRSCFVVR